MGTQSRGSELRYKGPVPYYVTAATGQGLGVQRAMATACSNVPRSSPGNTRRATAASPTSDDVPTFRTTQLS